MKDLLFLAREIEKALDLEGHAHTCVDTLRGVVRRFGFTPADAMDIMHDILSEILYKIHTREFRGHASIITFTYQISKNTCLKRLDYLNRDKRGGNAPHLPLEHPKASVVEADPRHWNPLELLKRRELEHLIRQCIQALDDQEYRRVFLLFIEGYERAEISKYLNIPVARVDAVFNYGKKKLARMMQPLML
jgi:RNA polymerase sigma factor (sigma-70 family)